MNSIPLLITDGNIEQFVAEGDVNIGEWSPRLRLGDYSPIFTSAEATNCFSIITSMIIRENKIIDQFPTPKHQQIWLPF